MAFVRNPVVYVPDLTNGRPIVDGKVYLLTAGTVPPTQDSAINPADLLTVTYVNEAGNTVTQPQPLYTSKGGCLYGSFPEEARQYMIAPQEYVFAAYDKIGRLQYSANDRNERLISADSFGLKGDGTDETAKLQSALNAAQGGILVFPQGKNYGYTNLEFKDGTAVVTNGSIFTRMAASTAHGIVLRNNITIDRLVIFSPGGAGGDRAILLTGSNFKADRVSVRATTEGTFTSTNWAFEIDSGSASFVGNIEIGSFLTRNYRNSMFAKRVTGLKVSNISVEFFQIAFYLQDCQNVEMNNAQIGGMSTTLTGNPGENGILIESTSNGASKNIQISNWTVSDSGEHGFRLGGQFTIQDVFFDNCTSIRPGRAGYVAWPSAVEWHGGCGFTVLGGTSATGRRHRNIHFNNCTVVDCDLNPSFGIGHGINNFTAFQVFVAEDVFLTDCKVKNSGAQAFAALQSLIIGATNNIHVSNFDCDTVERNALRLHDEPPTSPGWSFGINGLYIDGAEFRSRLANVAVCYMDDAKYAHSDWKIKGLNLYGGRTAFRFETPTTGSYPTDAEVEFSYQNSDSDEATVTTPIVTGAAVLRARVTAPWRVAQSAAPSLKNGSEYTDSITGAVRYRFNNQWFFLSSLDITPEMFGARGDGVANDTAAWQAAINYAQTNSVTIKPLAKEYLVGGLTTTGCNIQAESEFTFKQAAGSSFIINVTAGTKAVNWKNIRFLANGVAGYAFSFASAGAVTGENISISGFSVRAAFFEKDVQSVYFVGGVASGCTGPDVYCVKCNDGHFDNIIFRDCSEHVLRFGRFSTDPAFVSKGGKSTNSTFSNIGNDPVLFELDSQDGLVSGNTYKSCRRVVKIESTAVANTKNFIVENCTFDTMIGTRLEVILGLSVDNVSISNITANDGVNGLTVGDNGSISNCRISGLSGYAVRCGSNSVIDGVIASSIGGDAVTFIAGSSNSKVTNCTFTGITGRGVNSDGASHIITGNTFRTTGNWMRTTSGATDNIVSHNNVTGSGAKSILGTGHFVEKNKGDDI